ncbi:hypothetical protein ZWY2020_049044 [Hordeum vulgare]|nr:hypothetical protein ZWY2020_049044 [Hordeum vulgare]
MHLFRQVNELAARRMEVEAQLSQIQARVDNATTSFSEFTWEEIDNATSCKIGIGSNGTVPISVPSSSGLETILTTNPMYSDIQLKEVNYNATSMDESTEVLQLIVYGDEEWSFDYYENGSGVFSCPPGKNPMYTFRESIVLGKTSCSLLVVNRIARDLSREWPGASYELLSRNCNHFCNEFCDKLGVPKLPAKDNLLKLEF